MGNSSSYDSERLKMLMKGWDITRVSKEFKKCKRQINVNRASHEFGCSCHGEEVTLMHYAAAVCPTMTVIYLCDSLNGDVDCKATSNGVTPLMYSVIHKNSDNILPLCLRKCNLNTHDNRDEDTAFHYACKLGHLECVESLVKAGVDIEQKNKYGKTGLDCASFNGHGAVVSFIENHIKRSHKTGATQLDGPEVEKIDTRPGSHSTGDRFSGQPNISQDVLQTKRHSSLDTSDVFSGESIRPDSDGMATSRKDSANNMQQKYLAETNFPDSGAEDIQYDSIPYIDHDENGTEGAVGYTHPMISGQGENLQTAIRKNYSQLRRILRPDLILDEMFAESVIDMDEHTELKNKSIPDKNDFILKKVIGDPSLVKMFINLLHESGQRQLTKTFMIKRSRSEVQLNRTYAYAEYTEDL